MTDRDPPGMYEGDFQSLTTDDQFRKDVAKKFQTLDLRLSSQDIAIDGVKSEVKADVAAVKMDVAALRSEVSENTEVTKKIATDIASILSAWNDGVAAKRFFCRLADAWDFMLKRVCIPVGITLIVWAVGRAIFSNAPIPAWVGALLKFL